MAALHISMLKTIGSPKKLTLKVVEVNNNEVVDNIYKIKILTLRVVEVDNNEIISSIALLIDELTK